MRSCKICGKEFTRLAAHVNRSHNVGYEGYMLEFEYNGINPKCKCGCGNNTPFTRSHGMGFLSYIHGHSARIEGRLTAESKRKIGEKNRKNMKRYMTENPEHAKKKAKQMYSAIIPEVRKRSAKTNAENWQKPHMAEKRKEATIRAIELSEQGIIGPQAPFKTEWKFNPFTQQNEYMHSGWESRFLDECIEQDESVTKKHEIRIPYNDPNGVERTYVPDFLSISGSTLYEVKGQENDTDPLKYQAAISWCSQNDKKFCVIRF